MKLPTVRRELFLGMLSATLGSVLLSLLGMDLMLRQVAQERMERDLVDGQIARQQLGALRRSFVESKVQSLVETPYLKATILIPEVDQATLLQTARSLREIADSDLLLVVDARKHLLADSEDGAQLGQDLGGTKLIEQALEGQTRAEIWSYRDATYEAAAAPIIVGERVAGVLVVGNRLDSRTASAIRSVVRADVLLLDRGTVIGQSWARAPGVEPNAQELELLLACGRSAADLEEPTCFRTTLAGQRRLAVVGRVAATDAWVVLSTDLGEVMAPFRTTELVLACIGLTSALLALLISRLLSGRLARPMQDLTAASQRLARGDFAACVPASDNQEMNALATSFNVMARQIGELVHDVERTTRAAAEAEAAVRIKAQFLANMSHEIRTPMNGVLGMADLLVESELTSEQLEFVRMIQRSGQTLLTLINDILDFSKIEAGKLELESIPFDVRMEIEDTAELLSTQAHGKGLELLCLVHPDVPARVVGDPTRLRQVLLNLMGNALKFTTEGSVGVRVLHLDSAEGQAHLRFEVFDTGIGIPPEAAGQLFKAFTQADASTTRRYGGTGLGLAICRQLVQLMSGEIGVDSVPLAGSVFWFTVRLQVPDLGAHAGHSLPERLRERALLVVDDNPLSSTILGHQLRPHVRRLECVEDAAAALQMLHSAAAAGEPFDLALLDAHMPGTDGLELARSIRAAPELAALRLVLLGTPSAGDRKQELAGGFDAVVSKPVRESRLLEAVVRALGLASEPAPAGPLAGPEPRAALPAGTRPRVLLAEDNVVNQRVAARMLERLGCQVEVVCDGRAAVAAAARGEHDLVFMDCQMPELDGYEASRQIRAQARPDARRLVIVALTANALDGDRELCLSAGMDDYLTKPITLEALQAALTRHAHAIATPSA